MYNIETLNTAMNCSLRFDGYAAQITLLFCSPILISYHQLCMSLDMIGFAGYLALNFDRSAHDTCNDFAD